jgi:hypothetical protein
VVLHYSFCVGYAMKKSDSVPSSEWFAGEFQWLRGVALCASLGWLCPGLFHSAYGQDAGVETTDETADNQPSLTLADVRKVLRDLDADELQTRDAAEKRLIEMGPTVLAFLPEESSRTSGEMKVRLQRIRQALQQDDIETFFEASLVTLQGKLKLRDAIQQISSQTGNDIKLDSADSMEGVEVELAAQEAPFWSVMNDVMSQAKLQVNAFGTTQGELVLSPGMQENPAAPPIFTTGPFRMEVVSAQSTLPFRSPIGGQLDLSINLTWEPRLKPVFAQLPMASVSAELVGGKTLKSSNPQAAPEIPLNLGGCSTQIDLQLERPSRSESRIEKLAGEVVIAVPSDRHQYEFVKFGNGARQTEKYGDVTVTLEGARRNGSVYEMRVFVEFRDSQGALDSFRGWILSNEAYLLDAKQTRMENVGLQTYAITPNAVGIAYLFQINDDPDKYKLVYESPGAITKQTIRYELKDIELP